MPKYVWENSVQETFLAGIVGRDIASSLMHTLYM